MVTPAAEPTDSFEATLRIDEEPGYKAFQGVWLEREDGERWVADYRARPWWKEFKQLRVKVTGRRWTPEGQAIRAPHFKIHTLRPLDPKPGIDVGLGPETELRGSFAVHTWPAGSKLEGERATVFVGEGGERYWLRALPEELPAVGEPVTILAREVEPSPYFSRPCGRFLWVIGFECGDGSRPCWTEAEYPGAK